MKTPNAARALVGGLPLALVVVLAVSVPGSAQPPAKTEPEEPKKLNEVIEKSVDWYDVFPEKDAPAMKTHVVKRWRNVARGQEGEAMMVVWTHNGRALAVASIYPWEKKMCHEFDSLDRDGKLFAREKDKVIWSPEAPGVEFKAVPKAPPPAKTAVERLRQMKAIAESYKATMTGWAADDSDQEALRLLTREMYRYDLAGAKAPDPKLIDGALFGYAVQEGDPEVVLALEAIGTAERAEWQYALVRATSGGLEVKLGDEVVWTAKKYPASNNPKLPHFTMQRVLEK
jgi:hypothetical protein